MHSVNTAIRRPTTGLRDPWTVLLALAGLGNLATASWMLLDPMSWYVGLPGAVPDFGPYNEHFIRDLGCMFFTWAAAMGWAAWRPQARVVIVALLLAWFGTHALVHVYDTWRGFVSADHWVLDVPLCYAPAGLLAVMLVMLRRVEAREEARARLSH